MVNRPQVDSDKPNLEFEIKRFQISRNQSRKLAK
jgi:hypothetical protein